MQENKPKVTPPAINAQPQATPVAEPVVSTPAATELAPVSFNEHLEREHAEAQLSSPAPEAQAELPLDDVAPSESAPQSAAPSAEAQAAPVAQVAEAAPAEAAPVAQPAAREYKAEDVVEIGEQWQTTRAELQKYLTDVPQEIRRLNESATGYYQRDQEWSKLFGMPLEQAATEWKPLLERVNADPEFGEYLSRSIAHYFSETGTAAPSTQPNLDPAYRAAQTAQRTAEATQQQFATYLNAQSTQRAMDHIQAERHALVVKYPKLANPALYDIVSKHAYSKLYEDQSYTLTRAANDIAAHLNLADAPAQAASLTPAPEVPALVGSNGASPNGTRRVIQLADASNSNEATAQWLSERRALGYN